MTAGFKIKTIEIINNMARHNLIDAKYQQMAFRSVPTTLLFGIWSNKSDANLENSADFSQLFISAFSEIGRVGLAGLSEEVLN